MHFVLLCFVCPRVSSTAVCNSREKPAVKKTRIKKSSFIICFGGWVLRQWARFEERTIFNVCFSCSHVLMDRLRVLFVAVAEEACLGSHEPAIFCFFSSWASFHGRWAYVCVCVLVSFYVSPQRDVCIVCLGGWDSTCFVFTHRATKVCASFFFFARIA